MQGRGDSVFTWIQGLQLQCEKESWGQKVRGWCTTRGACWGQGGQAGALAAGATGHI